MPQITRTAILRERHCETCNGSFLSRSSKKRFCDTCLSERERRGDRERALAKLRQSGARAIGSRQSCKHCGADFTLHRGPEKFCEPCRAQRFNTWHREKRRTDPKRNLSERMTRRINASLVRGKEGKSWQDLVPYSLEDLVNHIERQFLPGMSWENRSSWHLDHIVPLSSFKFHSPNCEAFKAAWALSNLRPLWSGDNYKKSAKRTHLI